jgi:hypothetical protein
VSRTREANATRTAAALRRNPNTATDFETWVLRKLALAKRDHSTLDAGPTPWFLPFASRADPTEQIVEVEPERISRLVVDV